MKQLQYTFKDEASLNRELQKIRRWAKSDLYSTVLFQFYSEILDREKIEQTCRAIKKMVPDAWIVGCSSNGNIVNGDFSGGSIALICTLFEYPTTKIEILQYPLFGDTQEEVTRQVCQEVAKRDWVKGVELLATIRGMSMTSLCDGLSEMRKDIQVFGGGAFCEDLNNDQSFVYSEIMGYQEKSIVFILLGGQDLHLKTSYVTGWKPLGSYLNVTATDGYILKELNDRPAYETYYKYLHIRNDENFFNNTLEFPFLYHFHGIDIMRAPISSNPDGSLTMTSDIAQDVKARIAYGDPWTILEAAWQEGNRILQFSPECIHVFSCAARRTFWGNLEVGKETEPYQIVAPTSGFYTSGEFLRTGDYVNQHNVTQVIAAMREGEPKPQPEQELKLADRNFEGKVSMINRMATFISATTKELEEANRKLSEMVVTDALTSLGNRTAYFEKTSSLDDAITAGRAAFTVVVFDINGLKTINDTYSHSCGDAAIIDAAQILSSVFGKENLYRIGGDEFIAILNDISESTLEAMFSRMDTVLEETNKTEKIYKVPLAISKGASMFAPDTDSTYREVFRRADSAMYADKAAYYTTHDRRRRR
ncbi:MAG: diguanylate cyclase [Blautia sp.]|nr:diguanylate cyclase [Blautia sp.]